VLSHCVWPYDSGEVIVQNYNTLLTLSSLLDAADGIILVQNEALHAAAATLLKIPRRVPSCDARWPAREARRLSRTPRARRPTLEDLNGLAARALAAALLPARWRGDGGDAAQPAGLFADAATRLCSHPAQRLLTLLSVPQMPARSVDFTTFTWPALLKRLRQMLTTGASPTVPRPPRARGCIAGGG
jgi:tubulin delta